MLEESQIVPADERSAGTPLAVDRDEVEAIGTDVTYKAYIDNIKTQTGKGPEQYLAMAKRKGLTKHSELLAWLKTDMGLGHGHANAIILYIKDPELGKKKITEDAKREASKKK